MTDDQDKRPVVRVLQLLSNLGRGGAETWLVAWLRYLRDHEAELPVRLQVEFLLTRLEQSYYDDEVARLGARVHRIRYGWARLPRFARELRALLRSGKYDVLHIHQDHHAGIHLLCGLGRLPRIRVAHFHNALVGFRNMPPWSRQRAVFHLSRRLVEWLATDIVGTSRVLLTRYGFREQRGRPSLQAVHCGFQVEPFELNREESRRAVRLEFQVAPAAKLVLFAGRLMDSVPDLERNTKNPLLLMETMKTLHAAGDAAHLLVVGDGGEAIHKLRARYAGEPFMAQVTFTGGRTDLPRLMAAADVLVLPSLEEGLGMVAVEAQAAGLPVVASDGVPREAAVVPPLIRFVPLTAPPPVWAEAVRSAWGPPPIPAADARRLVQASPFSIENSCRRLIELYTGGGRHHARAAGG